MPEQAAQPDQDPAMQALLAGLPHGWQQVLGGGGRACHWVEGQTANSTAAHATTKQLLFLFCFEYLQVEFGLEQSLPGGSMHCMFDPCKWGVCIY